MKQNNHILRAEINLNSFRKNIKYIKEKYFDPIIILPVKANAYGHGDIIISREAARLGIDYLAVARVEEGIKLRENDINLPVINFGIELETNIDLAIKYNIEFSVCSPGNIELIQSKAKKNNTILNVHLNIDTGMRRLGCDYNKALELAEYINKCSNLKLKSIYTHYARSNDDLMLTKTQTELFLNLKKELDSLNIIPDFYHLHNSGAILNSLVKNMNIGVRPGIMCYGYSPLSRDFDLLPVMTLKTKVINIQKVPAKSGVSYGHTYITDRDTILAAISLGYGDGFPRILSNKMQVTINNRHYKQVGTITMDLTIIEVDESVRVGDDVIIFGDKKECINDADDLAQLADTISYEITTALNWRVKRIAVDCDVKK